MVEIYQFNSAQPLSSPEALGRESGVQQRQNRIQMRAPAAGAIGETEERNFSRQPRAACGHRPPNLDGLRFSSTRESDKTFVTGQIAEEPRSSITNFLYTSF